MFAGKKSAQIREILISESAWEEMTCLFAPSLNVVSQTQLVAIAPRWLAEEFSDPLNLQILPLPLKLNSRTCYLSWHEAAGRDKGHQWMEELLVGICRR